MHFSSLIFATLLALPQAFAQTITAPAADGKLVPYTSGLPLCATLCGPLFDVEGTCVDSQTCFCADARLQPFRQSGTAGVSAVCGGLSCTVVSDLEQVQSWYTGFCGAAAANPTATTTTGGAAGTTATNGATSTSLPTDGGGGNDSWFARHTKWVIMIIIIVVGLIALWIGAWYFRRRYLRRKEREIEMSPPVAWGPQQVHNSSGGYQYGDGIVDSGRSAPGAAGGHHKELASDVPVHGKRLSKSHMGWFKANK